MNIFNKIPLLKPKRNVFNLGFENRLTTDLFRLTPICIKEALPDDVFKIRTELFARVMPALNVPIMQRFNIRTYWFFVPTRIIWDDFEKWINPKSGVSELVAPRLSVDKTAYQAFAPKSLADYLGVNFGIAPEHQDSMLEFLSQATQILPDGFEISSLPFRAYQQIYNDWFIDLNNADPAEFSKASGVEDVEGFTDLDPVYKNLLKMRYRAWEHDYFTSAMPDPQRGPDVMAFDGGSGDLTIEAKSGVSAIHESSMKMPDAPVYIQEYWYNNTKYDTLKDILEALYSTLGYSDLATCLAAYGLSSTGDVLPNADNTNFLNHFQFRFPGTGYNGVLGASQEKAQVRLVGNSGSSPIPIEVKLGMNKSAEHIGSDYISISPAQIASALKVVNSGGGETQGVTVEELRVRMQMQSFLERNEIGGSRYTEMLYAHWGVKDPDGRLQRAEFIGGWKQPLMINEVTQTSAPTDEDPLGQYAGQGTSSSISKFLKYRVPEHGFIVGLMCIMPRTGYFQGLEKMWRRFDRLDYFWPSFAHLGEQEVKNHEVLFSGFDTDGTFGYQQRYAEYKSSYDQVHGDMKGSLAFWHGARAFATPEDSDTIPKLSAEFTTPSSSGQDGVDRIFPVLSSELPIFNADHFVVDIYNHILASRRMPKFVTPRNGS